MEGAIVNDSAYIEELLGYLVFNLLQLGLDVVV